jgi:HEPN domain-containing protein
MVDIDKHIAHWQTGAAEDFEVAEQLIKSGKVRHGLFFLHLTLEKILKALVCRHSRDIAPRLHNLVRLAELSGVDFQQKQIDFLAEMTAFNLEGRYPELWITVPPRKKADLLTKETGAIFKWMRKQLSNQ